MAWQIIWLNATPSARAQSRSNVAKLHFSVWACTALPMQCLIISFHCTECKYDTLPFWAALHHTMYQLCYVVTFQGPYLQKCHIFSRPGRSQGLLYKHLCHSLITSLSHFTEGVDFAYWWSISRGGSALQPAQQACFNCSLLTIRLLHRQALGLLGKYRKRND